MTGYFKAVFSLFVLLFFVFPHSGWGAEKKNDLALLQLAPAPKYKLVPGVLHLDTNLSGGSISPEAMVDQVREAGMRIAIITDKDNNYLEYGLWPLRNLIKKSVARTSIIKYGAAKYLAYMKKVEEKNKDMVVITGTETIPFYYWKGNIFSGLHAVNFHKNLLLLGLDKPEDFDKLPSTAAKTRGHFSFFALWPIFLFLPAVAGYFYKRRYVVFEKDKIIDEYRQPFKKYSFSLGGIALLFLLNNYPFKPQIYSPYNGEIGVPPFQAQIDFTNARNGISVWASPDIETSHHVIGPVVLETPPYYSDLLNTYDYTNVAVFAEGMKHTGVAGGIWDQVLTEFVTLKRSRPSWAVGEIDYENGDYLGETQTVFLLKELSKKAVFEAMKRGHCYAVTGDVRLKKPVLKRFEVWDEAKKRWLIAGERGMAGSRVHLRVHLKIAKGQKYSFKIVSNNKVLVKRENVSKTINEIFTFDTTAFKGIRYYRLILGKTLVSNPVFVKFIQ